MGWILTEVGSVPENVEFWLPFVAIFESCDASDTTQVFGNKHACRRKLNFQKPGKLRQKYGPGKKALLSRQKAEDKKTEQVTSGWISTVTLGASSRSHTRLSSVHFGEKTKQNTPLVVFFQMHERRVEVPMEVVHPKPDEEELLSWETSTICIMVLHLFTIHPIPSLEICFFFHGKTKSYLSCLYYIFFFL